MPYTLDGFSAVVGAPFQMEEMPPQPYSDSRMFRLKAYEALAVQAELGNAVWTEVYGSAYPSP
jgi:hypothetical protein